MVAEVAQLIVGTALSTMICTDAEASVLLVVSAGVKMTERV